MNMNAAFALIKNTQEQAERIMAAKRREQDSFKPWSPVRISKHRFGHCTNRTKKKKK